MSSFQQDILDLFQRRRGGHLHGRLYSDTLRQDMSGSALWHAFLQAHDHYYILPNEIQIIRDAAPLLAEELGQTETLIDLGVGDTQAVKRKILPILRALPGMKKYIGIDLSKDFLQAATNEVKANFPELKTEGIRKDFYSQAIDFTGAGKRLGVLFGSTVTNQEMLEGKVFPKAEIARKLAHIRNFIGPANSMLITYDGNRDVPSVLKAYDHIYWARHVTGIMYDIARKLEPDGSFKPAAWHHEMIWDGKAKVIHQCATASERQSFEIGGQTFDIQKGERFVTVNNFKYGAEQFLELCNEAGFTMKSSYQDKQGRMVLQHLGT